MPVSWYARSSHGRSGVTDEFIAVVCDPRASARVSLSTMRSSDQTAEAPSETPRTSQVSVRCRRRMATGYAPGARDAAGRRLGCGARPDAPA